MIDVMNAFSELSIYYFIDYPRLRHAVIEKLKEFTDYEDPELQESMTKLKIFIHQAFLNEGFMENEDSTIDDEDYDYLVQYVSNDSFLNA